MKPQTMEICEGIAAITSLAFGFVMSYWKLVAMVGADSNVIAQLLIGFEMGLLLGACVFLIVVPAIHGIDNFYKFVTNIGKKNEPTTKDPKKS